MNTLRYKEFQFATIVFVMAVPAQAFMNIVFIRENTHQNEGLMSFALGNLVFFLIYILFYGMTTRIDDKKIYISYGIGLIRKTVPLEDIRSVSVVTTPWYYGWGIRIIPNGMLYNINGSSGVELAFKDRSRILRIGSARSAQLAKSIKESLSSMQESR